MRLTKIEQGRKQTKTKEKKTHFCNELFFLSFSSFCLFSPFAQFLLTAFFGDMQARNHCFSLRAGADVRRFLSFLFLPPLGPWAQNKTDLDVVGWFLGGQKSTRAG
jgi:hypothetical protein